MTEAPPAVPSVYRGFIEAYEKEPNATHFNILREAFLEDAQSGFFEGFSDSFICLHLQDADLIRTCREDYDFEKVFSALLSAWLKNSPGTHPLITRLTQSLSPSQGRQMWDTLSPTLMSKGLPVAPLKELGIEVSAARLLWLLRRIYWRGIPDEDIIGELTRIIFSPTLEGSDRLVHTLRYDPSSVGAELLRFKAAPIMVKVYNEELYQEQLGAREIDPVAADMLISGWTGDFASFLDAAQSLSADKD